MIVVRNTQPFRSSGLSFLQTFFMKYQRLFLFQLFLFAFVLTGNAQSFFNSLGVTASGALQQHDNRRYRSEYSPDELRNQDGSDYQYAIGIHSNLWRKNAWAIDVGVGYSKYVNTFFNLSIMVIL